MRAANDNQVLRHTLQPETRRRIERLFSDSRQVIGLLDQIDAFDLLRPRAALDVVGIHPEIEAGLMKPYRELHFNLAMLENHMEFQQAPWVLSGDTRQAAETHRAAREAQSVLTSDVAGLLEKAGYPNAADSLRRTIPLGLPRTPSRG